MLVKGAPEVSDASNKRVLFGVRTGSAVLIYLEDGCAVEEKTNWILPQQWLFTNNSAMQLHWIKNKIYWNVASDQTGI